MSKYRVRVRVRVRVRIRVRVWARTFGHDVRMLHDTKMRAVNRFGWDDPLNGRLEHLSMRMRVRVEGRGLRVEG